MRASMSQDTLDSYVQSLEDMSPMPDDDAPQMTAELVDRYAELVGAIARELDYQFDARAVGALVRSFGLGDGFETYWATVHVILLRQKTPDFSPGDEGRSGSPCARLPLYRRACGNRRLWSGTDNQGSTARVSRSQRFTFG